MCGCWWVGCLFGEGRGHVAGVVWCVVIGGYWLAVHVEGCVGGAGGVVWSPVGG